MITRLVRLVATLGVLVFSLGDLPAIISAADAPDFTTFGYPTIAASMEITPDQAVTNPARTSATTHGNPLPAALLLLVTIGGAALAAVMLVRGRPSA